jgi:hypothetical protein
MSNRKVNRSNRNKHCRKHNLITCITGKAYFTSEYAAEKAIDKITDKQMRSYQCEFCGGIHLTSRV